MKKALIGRLIATGGRSNAAIEVAYEREFDFKKTVAGPSRTVC